MCCPNCLHYSGCRVRTDIRVHQRAQPSLPNPHYHLCRMAALTCDFDCKRCGRLNRETPRIISAQFAFGCCHRCLEYQKCAFEDRHRKLLEGARAAGEGIRHVETAFKDGQPVIPAGLRLPQNLPASSEAAQSAAGAAWHKTVQT